MPVRSRRALLMPNMLRRSMAYPRAGYQIIPGSPVGRAPAFRAIVSDPDTGEMLGVDLGVGDLENTRDTARYVRNWLGLYYSVPVLALAWEGGRNVHNIIPHSEDFEHDDWTKSGTVGVFGNEITFNAAADALIGYASDRTFSSSGGATWVNLTLTNEYKTYTASGNREDSYYVARVRLKAGTTTECRIRIYFGINNGAAIHIRDNGVDGGATIFVDEAQLEDVTANTEQAVPSEYCPTGTVAEGNPDGRKVFDTELDNTVADKVVTEHMGPLLPVRTFLDHVPAATNDQVYSNDQSNAAWSKTRSVSTKDQVGLDGLPNTACRMVDDESTGTGTSYVIDVIAVVSGQSNVAVAYLERDQLDWARFGAVNLDSTARGYFDLTNGVIGTEDVGVDDSDIIDLGNGIYKCLIEFTTETDTDGHVMLSSAEGNDSENVDLDGTSSILIHNIEVHKNKTLAEVRNLPPIFTAGAPVSISADEYSVDINNHDNDEVCYFFRWKPGYAQDESTNNAPILSVNGANGVLYDHTTAGRINSWDGATSVFVDGLTWTADDVLDVAVIASSDGTRQVCVNGVWSAAGAYTGFDITTPDLGILLAGYPAGIRDLTRFKITGAAAQKAKIDGLMS